jgi:hypothetical protein
MLENEVAQAASKQEMAGVVLVGNLIKARGFGIVFPPPTLEDARFTSGAVWTTAGVKHCGDGFYERQLILTREVAFASGSRAYLLTADRPQSRVNKVGITYWYPDYSDAYRASLWQ